jgi:hypothetical protein
MRQSLHIPRAPGRRFGAWVCLLAVALLWSPLWAAARYPDGADCCSGGFCPMHAHKAAQHPRSTKTAPPQTPTDSEHHGSAQNHKQQVDCAVSCCHESSSNLMAAMIFVLPEPATIFQRAQVIATIAAFAAVSFAPALDRSSPPPRTLLSSR